MIHRIKREERKHPFVIIDKRPLEDSRITWKAKGLLAYLLSRPDGWSVRPNHLATVSPCGKKAIRAVLKELATFGYARLERIRDKDGIFGGTTWVVGELPTELPVLAISVNSTEMPVLGLSGFGTLPKPDSPEKEPCTKNVPGSKKDLGARMKKSKKEGEKSARALLSVSNSSRCSEKESQPALGDVLTEASMRGVTQDTARRFFDYHENNNYWLNKNHELINWRNKLITWATEDRKPNGRSYCRAAEANHARPAQPDYSKGF